MDLICGMTEEFFVRGPILDKNGVELRIGDEVHYKRDGKTHITPHGNTRTIPPVDITFTISGFKNSPIYPRDSRDPTWVTGEGFLTPRGSKNSVSPKSIVKIASPIIKKVKPNFTFIKPSKRLHVVQKLTTYQKFKNLFKKW